MSIQFYNQIKLIDAILEKLTLSKIDIDKTFNLLNSDNEIFSYFIKNINNIEWFSLLNNK